MGSQLQHLFASWKKTFLTDALFTLGEEPLSFVEQQTYCTENLSTGLLPFLASLQGPCIELFGALGAGKTTMGLHLMHEHEKQNNLACYIDADHNLSSTHIKAIGIEPKNSLFIQPQAEICLRELVAELSIKLSPKLVIVDTSEPKRLLSNSSQSGKNVGAKEFLRLINQCAYNSTQVLIIYPWKNDQTSTFESHLFSNHPFKHYSSTSLCLRPIRTSLEHNRNLIRSRLYILRNKMIKTTLSTDILLRQTKGGCSIEESGPRA